MSDEERVNRLEEAVHDAFGWDGMPLIGIRDVPGFGPVEVVYTHWGDPGYSDYTGQRYIIFRFLGEEQLWRKDGKNVSHIGWDFDNWWLPYPVTARQETATFYDPPWVTDGSLDD